MTGSRGFSDIRRVAHWLLLAFSLIVGAVSFVVSDSRTTNAGTLPDLFTITGLVTTPDPDKGEVLCLVCHASKGMLFTLVSGEKLDLDIDQDRYLNSVHGENLTCTNCHQRYSSFPHEPVTKRSKREYSVGQYEVCKSCHYANYTKTLDSVHYKVLSAGNTQAPLCTDCHGEHYVVRAGQPRTSISQSCARCHGAIVEQYVASVHGAALKEGNPDVPDCTNCHGVHNIQDPRTATFRYKIPEMCGKCHDDAALMNKYGISRQVVKTYLKDFHGVTNDLLREQSSLVWSKEAECTDCHGVHDISRTDDPQSTVIKANLVRTCEKCHTSATGSFPAAWLSHYEPDWQKAPLVFVVSVFYRLFIPFVVGGLAILVLIDIWRIVSLRSDVNSGHQTFHGASCPA